MLWLERGDENSTVDTVSVNETSSNRQEPSIGNVGKVHWRGLKGFFSGSFLKKFP